MIGLCFSYPLRRDYVPSSGVTTTHVKACQEGRIVSVVAVNAAGRRGKRVVAAFVATAFTLCQESVKGVKGLPDFLKRIIG
ncbi:hypothetical protein CDEF62S_00146 [Castellaniella defragrans]